MNEEKKNEVSTIRRTLLKRLLSEHVAENDRKKKEIAKALGMQQAHLSRLYTNDEKGRRNITDRVAIKIEEYFDLPSGWLSDPNNLQLKQRHFLQVKTAYEQTALDNTSNSCKIPLLPSQIALDFLNNPYGTAVREYTTTSIRHTNQAVAITMPDNTMQPIFNKDDILIIEPNMPPISGDIVWVLLNPEHNISTLAQLRVEVDGSRYLSHTNPNTANTSQIDENVKVLGVVIERQTHYYNPATLSQRIQF